MIKELNEVIKGFKRYWRLFRKFGLKVVVEGVRFFLVFEIGGKVEFYLDLVLCFKWNRIKLI